MSIKFGNLSINSINKGSTTITKAYLGTKQEQQTVWTRGTFRTSIGKASPSNRPCYLLINSSDVNSTLLSKTFQIWYSNMFTSSPNMTNSTKISYGNTPISSGKTYYLYPAIVQFDTDRDNSMYNSGNGFTYIKRSSAALISWKIGSTTAVPLSLAEGSALSMNTVLGSFSSSKRIFFCLIGNSNNAISADNHIVFEPLKAYKAISINYKYSTTTTVTVPRQIF